MGAVGKEEGKSMKLASIVALSAIFGLANAATASQLPHPQPLIAERITPQPNLSPTELAQLPLAPTPAPTPISNPIPFPTPSPTPFPTPQPTPTPPVLPPPEQLIPSTNPELHPGQLQDTIRVRQFDFEGNTAFTSEELANVLKEFTNRPLTFAELLEARSAISKFYIDRGYVTTGALIPPQPFEGGKITIRVVEGRLEDIKILNTQRLDPGYIRSRLAIATDPPLNVPRLLEALRLLQLDPLIANISAELSAGATPGVNLLTVQVTEAKTATLQAFASNDRSPSVGEFRRGSTFREGNVTGLGDSFSFTTNNTDGSGGFDTNYTIPINPYNGTLSFIYGQTPSRVIESPFNLINIQAYSRYYDISLRQPIAQTPSEEFALGITASRRESNTTLLEIPFPLSTGADNNGSTRVSALRFFQEYTQRGATEVFAARSQFSIGLDALNSTINSISPDSRFVSWRGQAQWVRLLAPETLFLVRGDIQIADRSLLAIEQYGIGGQSTIRGYRQDVLLADNGALLTAEVRLPVIRIPEMPTTIFLIPFIDAGTVWNSSGNANSSPNTLAAVGLGLQMPLGNLVNIRIDYGIPLVSLNSTRRTWQENGIYFSVQFNAF